VLQTSVRNMERKKEIRKRLLTVRKEFPGEALLEQSQILAEKVLCHPVYAGCRKLFSYVSFRNEADTTAIIQAAFVSGKRVAVPRVNGKEMDFFEIQSMEELQTGSFGILEPKESAKMVFPEEGDLMLVPGAAFDPEGNRIGYGGGYYDRYLAKYPELYTIGLAYDFQMLEDLPSEEFDLKLKEVISV